MPADYTGALIALLLWAAAIWWAWRRAARLLESHPERSFRTIFRTILIIVATTVLAPFVAWCYERLRGRV
jgi:O-antigen/teichoic acid export membrane protein